MLNANLGDTLVRITPPQVGRACDCQSGKVNSVTDTTIALIAQADIMRRMVFCRTDKFDTVGLGSFIVRPDF